MLIAVATAALACGGTTAPETKDGGVEAGSDGAPSDASTSADTGTSFDATPPVDVFIPDDSGGVPLYGATPGP